MIKLSRGNNAFLIFLFFVNLVYFLTSAYINSPNDGGHFALVSALAENHSVKINDFVGYTQKVDYNLNDGDYYSDRDPGLAYVTLPFYLLGKFTEKAGLSGYLSYHDIIAEVFVIFLPNIAGTLSVLFLFKLFRVFGLDYKASFLSAAIFAFGTLSWMESTHLYSHALSMLLILLSVYLIVKMEGFEGKRIILAAAFLSYASLVEILNIIFVPFFIGYVFMAGKIRLSDVFQRRNAVVLAVAGLVFAMIFSTLLIYNYVAFDVVTVKTNMFNPSFPEEGSFRASLSGDLIEGLDRLFTNLLNPWVIFHWGSGVGNDTPGVFVVSPVLLLSLLGVPALLKRHRNEALLFVMLILPCILVVAVHKTVLTRHIAAIYPYMFFPLGFVVQNALNRSTSPNNNLFKRYSLLILVLALAIFSAVRVFYVISHYFGHVPSNPLMFVNELPSYVFFYGGLLMAYLILRRVQIIRIEKNPA